MGKKLLKLPSLFQPKEIRTKTTHLPWQCLHTCKQPKTLSFRSGDDIFKTVNSVFFDPIDNNVQTPEPWFRDNSSESEPASGSFSTESDGFYFDAESLERVIRGVRSERLFFEPGDTNSILEEAKADGFPFKESVVWAMESEDPYEDFRRSMEEMVESHGVKDWERLKELLSWYLRVNGKKNHAFIVDAFVDLLLSLCANTSASSTSYSSAVSSFASSPLS